MKKMKCNLIVITAWVLLSGCSSTPETPKPEESKYALQIVEAHVPSAFFMSFSTLPYDSEVINEILISPDIKRREYPIVYAGMGEVAVVDQTTTRMLPEDYSIVDGEVVAHEKEHKLGTYISAEILEAKEEATTIAFNFKFKQLIGYDTHSLDDKTSIDMPMFQARELNPKKLTLAHSTWLTIGGLTNRDSEGNEYTWVFLIRIIPPNT
jgi:uncharacterized protein YceK